MAILRETLKGINFDDVATAGQLPPVTPGEILRKEFLAPLNMSARALARDIGVPPNRITDILNGDRSITAQTALKLAAHFGTSALFWMNLQVAYDLTTAEREMGQAA
ncbi:HigA family addiction module antitoxin [Acidiphilium multivorum]|uniref:HigA family addiction module antitoxin n=1 Tax=Acidiphilium multivorum TaxID=62140 RepID=UPI001B8B5559|nr:HigA family addiction module antitoxin [Acidiphilium multivorum]MBS3025406.1 HigA family addiction module antidote protein [Acidiphilium multivorum]